MRRRRNAALAIALIAGLTVAPLTAQSPPVVVTDSRSLREALATATAGTTIEMAPGDYDGFSHGGLRGDAKAPIVVRAGRPDDPPRFRGSIHLSDVEHVEFDGMVLTDSPTNGLNLDDGGSYQTPSHHVVLRRITVHDIGGRGNHDGIKLSGVDDFQLLDCTVERWGRGGSAVDMVGCHRGRLEGCTFRDLATGAAANGVQMKGGTCDVVVRRCRFDHAGQRAVQLGGSTGRDYFRPAAAGFEAKDLVVEGCTFTGSSAPIAFVGCDGAIVRHNTIWLPQKWVLRILQETRDPEFVPCRGGAFTDNLIVFEGLATIANVGPDTAPATFTFARNWWFRRDAPERSRPALPTEERDGRGGADPGFRDAAAGDLRLDPDSPARRHGADSLPEPRRPQ